MTANTPDAKQPSECSNMSEIRAGIDQIDRHIISLLGDRFGYVHEAAKFKTSEESVRALDRVERMLEDRRTWAAEEGLQPEAIRKLYADLIQYFTEHELNEWSTPR